MIFSSYSDYSFEADLNLKDYVLSLDEKEIALPVEILGKNKFKFLTEETIRKFSITNMNGQLIMVDYDLKSEVYDFSFLDRGVYIVKYETDKIFKNFKFLVL